MSSLSIDFVRNPCDIKLLLIFIFNSMFYVWAGLCRTSEIFGISKFIIGNMRFLEDKNFETLSVTSQNGYRLMRFAGLYCYSLSSILLCVQCFDQVETSVCMCCQTNVVHFIIFTLQYSLFTIYFKFKELPPILAARGASYHIKGKIYSACVQSVLTYGIETWMMKA